jgi:5-methylcytosine-specific restriction protein A
MPTAARKPCSQPGCGELADGRYCPGHTKINVVTVQRKQYDASRGSSAERGYDWEWRRHREWYLNRHSMCEASKGCDQPANEVHHIIRLSDGGDKFDPANMQALCKSHHSSKRGQGGRV